MKKNGESNCLPILKTLDEKQVWILSKSVKTLLINDAVNQIEILFNSTKITAEIEEISIYGQKWNNSCPIRR